METKNTQNPFTTKPVIPSVHQRKELLYAMAETGADWIMLKLGDVNTLPQLVGHIHRFGKKVMVHQDSIKGIARDKMGIQYMANCGVDCVITMKAPCVKYIKEVGMVAAFGFFVIDSDACRTGLANVKEQQPDVVILMPGTIPPQLIKAIKSEAGTPIILGGLMTTGEQIVGAMATGVAAVATSNPELWNCEI
ncbi:glycerol-3-phosphate responsive antiterminator [Acetobacterium wieringae]|uniref:glycerol-3-phosphate responsive antiterminator n=1 Tax=Acetobacterium wieringae TaxID=52694 RepID=UPI0026ED4597|nr:glycerol-3-phosphate responsive antiterminator [Acetobacterium wieringae]